MDVGVTGSGREAPVRPSAGSALAQGEDTDRNLRRAPEPDAVAGAWLSDPPEEERSAATRILVVEDDWAIQSALATFLGDEGYEVSLANDGEQALARLAEDRAADLILLDLRLPVM